MKEESRETWYLKKCSWTSLVVQWLRLYLPMQGTQVWSLLWEDATCHGEIKLVHHNYLACALQQESSLWSLQLEKSLSSNKDPAQSKINKYVYLKKYSWWPGAHSLLPTGAGLPNTGNLPKEREILREGAPGAAPSPGRHSIFPWPTALQQPVRFLADLCVLFWRQCALTALRDVRRFLSEEGGHVAVSITRWQHLGVTCGSPPPTSTPLLTRRLEGKVGDVQP